MRKKILALLAAVFMGLGGAVAVAAPAAASHDQCPEGGYWCVWNEANFAGAPDYYWTITSAGTGGFCVNYLNNLALNVDSAKVTGSTALSVTQYSNLNCSGTSVSFMRPSFYGGPNRGACASTNFEAWACFWDGAGSYRAESAWIIKS